MHVVICKYAADPDVVEKMRPHLAHLEQTMRQTTGFVAYYYVEADDG
jgi:quinol monooxygenase YgiN